MNLHRGWFGKISSLFCCWQTTRAAEWKQPASNQYVTYTSEDKWTEEKATAQVVSSFPNSFPHSFPHFLISPLISPLPHFPTHPDGEEELVYGDGAAAVLVKHLEEGLRGGDGVLGQPWIWLTEGFQKKAPKMGLQHTFFLQFCSKLSTCFNWFWSCFTS